MSFYTSLSGLKSAQTDMSSISHNLANVATNGFKKSRAEFADVIASSVTTAPNQIIGSGVVTKGLRQQFGTGSMTQSTSALDLAIAGNGFFAVKGTDPAGTVSFTRNGSFAIDAGGYIVDGNGNQLQGYGLDANGKAVMTELGNAVSFRVPETNDYKPTENVKLGVTLPTGAEVPLRAFDRTAPATYNHSVQTTAYDAGGKAVTLTNYFVRQPDENGAPSNAWSVYTYAGNTQLGPNAADPKPTTVFFDAQGNAYTGTRGDGSTVNEPIAFGAYTPGGNTPTQEITLDLTTIKQSASAFSVQSNTADGSALGDLSGVTVGDDGVVLASFTDGSSKALGKVIVANFTNPAGLRQIGSSGWSSTGLSGEAKLGMAGENGFGGVMSGMIEGSNVDITEELVGLIAAQRNFQANAKALDTASQISQSILNIRA